MTNLANKRQEIVEEFSKKITHISLDTVYINTVKETAELVGLKKILKEYLENALNDYAQSIIEMVESQKIEVIHDNGLSYPVGALHRHYNQALEDIKRLIKTELEGGK